MFIADAPLATTAHALRSGQLDLPTYVNEICNRIDAVEPSIQALLPEPDRRSRLLAEATTLQERFPDAAQRPPLYGIPLGVKDMFRVDGFPTRAGSQLPAELFAGPEAACVTRLRAAGVLILGKTVSCEFAYFAPAATRNPHNLDHTPGGSSSGSAAAVAAGFCPLALGTQTVGSTIRPAAFCGVVGFKPTYGRIATAGLIACAESLDTVGIFTQDGAGIALVAPLLCKDWQPTNLAAKRPVLGVPDGPYLSNISAEALAAFEARIAFLEQAGYTVRRVPALDEIEAITRQNFRLLSAELAQVHAQWFAHYGSLYHPRTSAAIEEGQEIAGEEVAEVRAGRATLRATLEALMSVHGIDLWVCPSALGPAPEGLGSTGNGIMNLPWTYAGLPVITIPVGRAANGLPLGLQCVSAAMADERLVAWAVPLAKVLKFA